MKKHAENPFTGSPVENHQRLLDFVRSNKLKPSAQRLILYMLCVERSKREPLKLEINDITSSLGISRSSFYEAKASLCDLGIIVPKNHKEYWINPRVVSIEEHNDIQPRTIF